VYTAASQGTACSSNDSRGWAASWGLTERVWERLPLALAPVCQDDSRPPNGDSDVDRLDLEKGRVLTNAAPSDGGMLWKRTGVRTKPIVVSTAMPSPSKASCNKRRCQLRGSC
jgi:hypothetical protein